MVNDAGGIGGSSVARNASRRRTSRPTWTYAPILESDLFGPIAGQFPGDGVANADHAARHDLGEHSASPVGPHGRLQTGRNLVHSLARRELAADHQSRGADHQNLAASVSERHAAEKNVRASPRRVSRRPNFFEGASPRVAIDERDLATPAPIYIARQPLSRDERCLGDKIHRTAVDALEPDGFYLTGRNHSLTVDAVAPIQRVQSRKRESIQTSRAPCEAEICRRSRRYR